MAKDAALVEEATRLYVREGLGIKEISEQFPEISERTLWDWSSRYRWKERRDRYRQQSSDLDAYVNKIKMRLAEALMAEEPDPQLIYALTKGLAVLKPSAAVELRKIEQEEKEGQDMSPEERRAAIKEIIETEYGITRDP